MCRSSCVVVVVSSPEHAGDNEVKYVIEESRREITKLVAVFVDLYTTHDLFRSYALSTRVRNKVNDCLNSSIDLDGLFSQEYELVSYIVGGIQHGIISNSTLNEIIKNLSNERFMLKHHRSLPFSTHPNSSAQIVSDPVMCTFQLQHSPIMPNNVEPLKDLGTYISHLIDSFDNPEPLTINLGGIVAAYNNAIRETNLNKITIPRVTTGNSSNKHTLSRSAIVTIPGDYCGDFISMPSNSQAIPMYNGNLTAFTDSQLIDILVYIDSLRDTNGSADTRFANLQNEITHELARRKHTT